MKGETCLTQLPYFDYELMFPFDVMHSVQNIGKHFCHLWHGKKKGKAVPIVPVDPKKEKQLPKGSYESAQKENELR